MAALPEVVLIQHFSFIKICRLSVLLTDKDTEGDLQ